MAIKESEDLRKKRAHVEKMDIVDPTRAANFFNCSQNLLHSLKDKYPKMPFTQTEEGFRCSDVVGMFRFWTAFNRDRNKGALQEIIYWWEHDPNFEPFLQDIPPINSYK